MITSFLGRLKTVKDFSIFKSPKGILGPGLSFWALRDSKSIFGGAENAEFFSLNFLKKYFEF